MFLKPRTREKDGKKHVYYSICESLRVCLKKRAARVAPSLTPWSVLDQVGRIVLVDVWFELADGRMMRLPRITQPEPAQALLLAQLGWSLPAQPPPRIYIKEVSPMI